MKKIINGKKYDTETAAYICGYVFGTYNDLFYNEENLYRKKNGEFFFYGYGGPGTSYKCEEIIEPFTESEAKNFIEKYGDVETYEELFGEVEE